MIWTYDGYLHMSSQPRNFQIIGVSQSFSRVISGIRGHTRTRPHHTPSQTRTVRLPPFNTRLSTRSRERLNCGFVRSVSPSPQRTGRSHAALCPVAGTAWARGRDCDRQSGIRGGMVALDGWRWEGVGGVGLVRPKQRPKPSSYVCCRAARLPARARACGSARSGPGPCGVSLSGAFMSCAVAAPRLTVDYHAVKHPRPILRS